MNLWFKTLTCAALCICFISNTAYTQTARAGEGLSRQMTAIKNQMESFKTHVDGEISTITGQLNSVTSTVNSLRNTVNSMSTDVNTMKRCSNRNKIYAPNHSNADRDGCRPDNRMQCTTVSWHGGRSSPGAPINNQGLEFPREGGQRFMIRADAPSVNKRCQERGYDHGFVTKIFSHKEWCRYSNANVRAYTGSSNNTGPHNDKAMWRNVSCSNAAAYVKCCKQVND